MSMKHGQFLGVLASPEGIDAYHEGDELVLDGQKCVLVEVLQSESQLRVLPLRLYRIFKRVKEAAGER